MANANESWVAEWQSGTIDFDKDTIAWIRSRPDSIRSLMLKFPPSCLVRGKISLMCPAVGSLAIVTSYIEPDEENKEGLLTVRDSPKGDIKYHCKPEWLEVVGYYKGLDFYKIKDVLEGRYHVQHD